MIRFLVAVFALVAGAAVLAGEAAPEAVTEAAGGVFGTGLAWKEIAAFLLGMLGMKLASWVAAWLDGKGATFIQERLAKIQESANKNEVLAQIAADDALFKIVSDSIPEVLGEIGDTAKKDLADGKLNKVDWNDIGSRIWSRVKPHVEGGKNDYLKNSSFSDGKAMAAYFAQKWAASRMVEVPRRP